MGCSCTIVKKSVVQKMSSHYEFSSSSESDSDSDSSSSSRNRAHNISFHTVSSYDSVHDERKNGSNDSKGMIHHKESEIKIHSPYEPSLAMGLISVKKNKSQVIKSQGFIKSALKTSAKDESVYIEKKGSVNFFSNFPSSKSQVSIRRNQSSSNSKTSKAADKIAETRSIHHFKSPSV